MPKLLHILLLLSLVFTQGQPLSAAPIAPDSGAVAPLVPQYLIRRWYTSPDVEPFHPHRYGNALRGISLVGYYSPQIELSPTNANRSFVPISFGIGVLKDFNKSHALRIAANYVRADYPAPFTDESVHNYTRYGLSADYLINLSNHWFGYNPARSLETLISMGVTGGVAVADQDRADSEAFLQGQFGIQVRKTLSPRLSLFVEPYYYVATDKYDFYSNYADFDDGVGVKAGLQMRLTPPYRQTPWFPEYQGAKWYDNLYLQNLVGVNIGWVDGQKRATVGLDDYNFSLAVGHWIAPSYGFRAAVSDLQLLTTRNDGKVDNNYRHLTLRGEGVLNLLSLFDRVSLGRVGVDLSGGAELSFARQYSLASGVSKLKQSPSLLEEMKFGVTGAAQVHYFLSNRFALVGEGRVSIFGRHDGMITPSLGFEYYTSNYPRYHAWTKKGNEKLKARLGESFTFRGKEVDPLATTYQLCRHNLFVEVGAGAQVMSNSALSTYEAAPTADFAIGYRFNQLHAVRFREHMAAYYRAKHYGTSADSHHALDYMFDLTNFVFGPEPNRRYSLRPFVGGVYSLNHINKQKKGGEHEFGAEFGLQNVLQLNSNVGLYVEPRYMYQFSDANRWNLSAGITYTIEHPYQRPYLLGCGATSGLGENSHLYAQVLGSIETNRGIARKSTPAYTGADVTVGHTFGRVFALQGTLFSTVASLNEYGKDYSYGIRGEFVGDILRAFWPSSHEQGWAFTGQVGWDYSRSVNSYRSLHGPTAATQIRRRLFNTPLWLVLQGRFQSTSNRYPLAKWSAQAGLHYELPSSNARVMANTLRQQTVLDRSLTDPSRHPFFISGAVTWFDANKLGGNFALGYQITPLHAIRLGYDHAATGIVTFNDEKVYVNAASVDYMLDLSQLVMGRKRTPRLHILPVAGVSALFHSFQHSTMTPGKLDLPTSNYFLALDAGFEIDYRLSQHFSVAAGQKFLYAPTDNHLNPYHTRFHRYWHSLANFSLKLHL